MIIKLQNLEMIIIFWVKTFNGKIIEKLIASIAFQYGHN